MAAKTPAPDAKGVKGQAAPVPDPNAEAVMDEEERAKWLKIRHGLGI